MVSRFQSLQRLTFFVLIALLLLPTPVARAQSANPSDLLTPQVAGDEFWDDRFGLAGLEGQVYAAVVAANGDLYIGGDFTKVGGIEAKNIARWDGRSWHPLGAGLNQRVAALAIDGDTVYVAGDFTSAGAVTVAYIAKWSGTAWSKVGNGVGPMDDSFGFPEPGRVKTLLVGDGGLYAGGNFVSMDGVAANNVVFWNGQKWSALGNGVGRKDFDGNFSGGQGDVRALLLDGDDLYVAGGFDMAGESEGINAVARWDGTNWSGLGSGFIWDNNDGTFSQALVTSLAKVKTTLYAGGIFNRADGQPAARLAGWDGTSWSEAGGGVAVREFSSDNGVNTLLASGDQLIVGGNFVAAGGQAIDLLASWDGAKWSEVGEGLQNPDGFDTVLALAAAPEGGIYIGGSYKFGGNLRIDNIGLWDGQLWHPLGKGLAEQAYGDSPADIYALGIDDAGRVYAGGEFEYAGGLKVENLAMWDGEAWRNIGGTNGRIRTLVVVGDDLYIGGEFTRAGGIAANHVARWNRATAKWSALSNGINGSVYALVFSNGLLYAGGGFTAAGTVTATDVAFWDGAQWHGFGDRARIYERSQEGGEIGTYVNALAVAGNVVYIGGHFQTIQFGLDTTDLNSFTVVHNLVAWDSRTDQWNWVGTPLNPGVSNNGHSGFGTDAHTLALVGDLLYVGGAFNQAGTVAATNLARYNITTGEWSAPGNSVGGFDDSIVRALATYGTDLYVGGHFTVAGDAEANFVARFDTLTDEWSALGGGVKWYNDNFTNVKSLATHDSGVYVGGEFDQAGGRSAPGFARWGGPLAGGNVPADQGGQVAGPDGLTLAIPAGAAADDLIVRLAAMSDPRQPLPEGQGGARYLGAAATTLTGEAVVSFLKPYTLKVPYTAGQLAAAGITDPSTLNLLRWDGAAWQPLLPCAGCSVDATNRVVTVVADQFGEFALAGAVASPEPTGNRLFLPLVQGGK